MNKSHVLKLKKIQPTTRTRNKTAQDKLKKKKEKDNIKRNLVSFLTTILISTIEANNKLIMESC